MTGFAFPFVARGVPGEIRITYSVNENPDRWGFDILGLEGDVSRAAAFPVFEASVSYEGEGYASIFGWIQVVHYWKANAEAPEWSLLDAPPQLRGLGVPFQTWGSEPRCFDAPLDTPDGISVWQAVTFLTQTPDGLLSRLVEPLVGVTWGYSVADGNPTISPLSLAAQPDWDGIKVTLERDCPLWTFGDELPNSSRSPERIPPQGQSGTLAQASYLPSGAFGGCRAEDCGGPESGTTRIESASPPMTGPAALGDHGGGKGTNNERST